MNCLLRADNTEASPAISTDNTQPVSVRTSVGSTRPRLVPRTIPALLHWERQAVSVLLTVVTIFLAGFAYFLRAVGRLGAIARPTLAGDIGLGRGSGWLVCP